MLVSVTKSHDNAYKLYEIVDQNDTLVIRMGKAISYFIVAYGVSMPSRKNNVAIKVEAVITADDIPLTSRHFLQFRHSMIHPL